MGTARPTGYRLFIDRGCTGAVWLICSPGLADWLRIVRHFRATHYGPKRRYRSRIRFCSSTLDNAGSPEWVSYTATLAVFAGLVYLLLGLLRMGWVSHFLSGAVLGGFVFGFGIGLIVDQTPKILGVPKSEGSYFDVLIGVLQTLPATSVPTLIVGVLGIVLLLLMRRFVPKLPRTIIVVAIGIIISSMFALASYGVSIVGPVPTGLPSLVLPTMPPVDLSSIVLGSLAILFIGYSESLAAAKEEGSKYDYEIDASQEMVAQGVANVASGLLGGYAVEGSLSKTTVADMAGQKTQLASLLSAVLILLTILFLAGFFTNLPNAVLGAVVIDAGISLVKIRDFQHYSLSSQGLRRVPGDSDRGILCRSTGRGSGRYYHLVTLADCVRIEVAYALDGIR